MTRTNINRTNELALEIHRSIFGDPWHGTATKEILNGISVEYAFRRPITSGHNIIELTLHLDAWTEEVLSRFTGNPAKEPAMGDWPPPQEQTEEYWLAVKQKLFSDTNKLIETVKSFPENKLDEILGEERNITLGTGFSFEGLIIGLVQHNAYHSGQIALLKKILTM